MFSYYFLFVVLLLTVTLRLTQQTHDKTIRQGHLGHCCLQVSAADYSYPVDEVLLFYSILAADRRFDKRCFRCLGRLMLISAVLFGASFLMFGLVRSIPLAAIAYVINGAAWTCCSISATSLVQRIVNNEVRGRVMSLFMISGAVAQINALGLGMMSDLAGLVVIVPLTSLLCTLLILLLITLVPALRELD
jgi:MFS family permease